MFTAILGIQENLLMKFQDKMLQKRQGIYDEGNYLFVFNKIARHQPLSSFYKEKVKFERSQKCEV